MNKQVTALENWAQRTTQSNSDTGTMAEPHWHSIAWCGVIANRGWSENVKEVTEKQRRLEGTRSGYFSQRDLHREARSWKI